MALAPRNLINLICEVSLQACFDEAVAIYFGEPRVSETNLS
jgi:hypothetical protein